MVAPSVPGTLLTPIAPHSLSFRPLVVPESSEIEIHLPPSARSHARYVFKLCVPNSVLQYSAISQGDFSAVKQCSFSQMLSAEAGRAVRSGAAAHKYRGNLL